MIFASVGSSTIPFDRLVRALEGVETDEDLVVQTGVSTVRPRRAKVLDYLGYDEFVALIRSARVVVTHAGAGSVITALGEGKRPIVVPRRAAQREAVDDHQVTFARRAAELGLVTVVEDVSLLAAALRDHEPSPGSERLRAQSDRAGAAVVHRALRRPGEGRLGGSRRHISMLLPI